MKRDEAAGLIGAAGMPATRVFAATSRITTAPASTHAARPTVRPGMTVAPMARTAKSWTVTVPARRTAGARKTPQPIVLSCSTIVPEERTLWGPIRA